MTEYKKVFLDTTPLIYFLDADANYAEKVELILGKFIEADKTMITSTITCTEYLTYPYRTGNTEKNKCIISKRFYRIGRFSYTIKPFVFILRTSRSAA